MMETYAISAGPFIFEGKYGLGETVISLNEEYTGQVNTEREKVLFCADVEFGSRFIYGERM